MSNQISCATAACHTSIGSPFEYFMPESFAYFKMSVSCGLYTASKTALHARINELAKKSKTTGLTDAEKAEQQALRQEYVADVKASLRAQLNNTSIKEPDGTVHKLGKKN